jgi:hypothetical protein
MTPDERFWSKVAKAGPDDCWLWTAAPNSTGHVSFYWDRKTRSIPAIRAAWFFAYGEWPEHVLDHTCSVPRCMNVRHLEDVTQAENCRRTSERGRHPNQVKTACRQGHEYIEENTRYGTRGDGTKFRICLKCERERTHAKRGPEKERHPGPKRR